ncbi:hypothetical protein LMH87_005327 [Akanthomyces muscarius]|uniref:AB hydrolase-1 domain-containing protein n=1 Tax=Akanthomyces muscarius TaxID=2231603 RepID=A0A9W8QKH5_AKAMU|nr:hypothetical protein LMH87_005327 [Akanthomyces muscarius]KAJ4163608.1 hypothetical protein LMH87_005327 [Akanthomyces muscarius]
MIGNSPPEWALIQVSVIIFRFTPLFYLLPLLALSAYSIYDPFATPHHTAQAVLIGLLLAEAVFYVFLYRPQLRVAATTEAVYPKALTKAERQALFQQCLAHAHDTALYLRGWFLNAPLDDIRRDNVREFLLWAFFETSDEDAAAAHNAELDGYVATLEDRMGRRFAPGRGTARSLRLTLEPVTTAYRSLAWYVVIALVDGVTHAFLRAHGFRFYGRSSAAEVRATFPPRPQELFSTYKSPAPALGYWYYGPNSQQQQQHQNAKPRTRASAAAEQKQGQQLPVVFFHGIGVGLLTYLRFLFDLVKAANAQSAQDGPGVRIIAVEMLPVSFRLTSPPLDKRAFLAAFASILDAHGWDEFAIVSHSYGSVPTTHILTADGEHTALSRRVEAATLVDPVTIMLQLPHVAYNFTRRRPRTAAEWQLWYFASADVGVATVLGRHFHWRQNIIWKEDLLRRPGGGGHRRVTVSLAAKDIIVNAPAVAEYLQEPEDDAAEGGQESRVGVLWFPELDHAQVFDTPSDYNKIIKCVLAEGKED